MCQTFRKKHSKNHFPKRLKTKAKNPVINTPIIKGVAGIQSRRLANFMLPLFLRYKARIIIKAIAPGINQTIILP